MKKNKLIFAVVFSAIVIALGSIAIGFAADSAAGTSADPVVTKSYVDKAISALAEKIGAEENNDTAACALQTSWNAVPVEKDKTVICGAGTQFILRSGQSVVYDVTENGLSDLTSGQGLYSGDSLSYDHLVLVPRADGRGFECTTDCWFMICGAYEVK